MRQQTAGQLFLIGGETGHNLVSLLQETAQLLTVVLSVSVPHIDRPCLPTNGTARHSDHTAGADQVTLLALIYGTGGSLRADGTLQVGLEPQDLVVDVEQAVLLLVAPQLVLYGIQP